MTIPRPSRLRVSLSLLAVAVLLLPGCGSYRYREDYNNFNAAYAESSNRQMLLNLARLDQHDPTYFLQFGQISVQYNWSGSINGTVNNTVPQSTFRVPIVSELGTVSAGGSTQPTFTFIPVTDDKVSQQLLQPVSTTVLYTLFQQGWPVDQLLRLMVERFEIQLPGESEVSTFTNSVTRGNVKSYATFLKICAIAREFQIDGHLKLVGNEEFVPLADGWSSATAPTAKDLLDAQDKHLIYKQIEGKWQIGSSELVPSFVLENGGEETFKRLEKSPIFNEGHSLDNMRVLLANGFSVEGNFKDVKNSGSRLVLRSFLSILAAAAQEQAEFDVALQHTSLMDHIPKSEALPILRLRWDDTKTAVLPPLISVDYRSQNYQVTDPVSEKIGERASWNRDVFRLLTELGSQVSVDISKFSLPTTLQVLSNP